MSNAAALVRGALRASAQKRIPCFARASALALATYLLLPSGAAATTLVSKDLAGDASGGCGFNRSPGSSSDFSPDGRFVLFTSTATDLVPGVNDTNGVPDVFLYDFQEGSTAIVSVDADGNALGTTGGNDFVAAFVFSPDSRWLLFRTQAAHMVAGLADTNDAPDWFVRNLLTGETSCITINAAGTATGDETSFTDQPPVFSPDGKLLAFTSLAGDLVTGVSDLGGRDLFVRDLDAGTTSLVDITTDGTASNESSADPPKFSPDGRYLAFVNGSPKLVSGVNDPGSLNKLFVRDLQTDTTILITQTTGGDAAELSAFYEWAPDGHAILFASASPDLAAGVADTNDRDDLFLWNSDDHTISAVSVTPDGGSTGDAISHGIAFSPAARYPAFSPDSRYVAFTSASTNLTPESAGGDVREDLYVRDTQTETTNYIARNETASVAFGFARFSPDGAHLLFESDASDVVSGLTDTNGTTDLFLYDLATGTTSAVTINTDATATANSTSTSVDDVVVSPDGRYVSFVSDATNLVPEFVSTSTRDLFVRDLVAGVTSLVTVFVNGGGAGYDQYATRDAAFSLDSRFLVFTDNAELASQVTNPFNFNFATNLYAFDVVDDVQHLLTVDAAGDTPADPYVSGTMEGGVEPFSFIVDPAGGSVLFLSTFTDMVAGVNDAPLTYDVFLTGLPAGSTASECGDPVPDTGMTAISTGAHLVKASDALFILRVAVGAESCDLCVCDVDGSGTVTASDALATLKIAVGQQIALACPAC